MSSILSNIPNNLLSSVPKTPTLDEETNIINKTLSGDEKVKQNILENAFPDSVFMQVPLEQIESNIETKIDTFMSGLLKLPTIPNIPFGVSLPKVVIPNPAEIRQFINKKIENIKRKQQEALITAQLHKATLEETPFTVRNGSRNQIQEEYYG